MERKAGGALAVGTLVVALGYYAADRSGGPPSADRAAASGAGRATATQAERPASAGNAESTTEESSATQAERPWETVTVYYATDRQVLGSPTRQRAESLAHIGLIAGIAFAAFAGWFGLRGRQAAAYGTAIAGGVVALTLIMGSRWFAGWGVSESALAEAAARYGPGRGQFEVGVCEVTIPRDHREGEVERPSILKLELRARPDRHVMLRSTIPQERAEFFEEVRTRVQASANRDAFVFVHGFNVTFDAAARRTAQMAYDLRFEGAPVFYSWPSQGAPWDYTIDETNVVWSVPHLKQFLVDLIQQSDAQALHLVAHSMGTRCLTQAITELSREGAEELDRVHQIVLAAPDIDADVFREQIAPAITRRVSRVTVYASPSDEALAASKVVHGAQRAGESLPTPLVVPGVETIDVAVGGLGLLGHSYYGSNPLILRDLSSLLYQSASADGRPWLQAIGRGEKCYWRLTDTTAVAREVEEDPPQRR